MERMTSRKVTGPNGFLASGASFFPIEQSQDGSGRLGRFDMYFHVRDAAMFDGGAQYTPRMLDFSAVQGPIDIPLERINPDFASGFGFQDRGSVGCDVASTAPMYPSVTQVPDLGTGHLVSLYDTTPKYPIGPRILLDQTDGGPTMVEGGCYLEDPIPLPSEVMPQPIVGVGIPSTQDVNWLQGGAIGPQFPSIGSELIPHARPSELGNEYVPFIMDDVAHANSNLSSDHQEINLDKAPPYHAKLDAHTEDDVRFLGPKKAHVGRRRSVPPRRSRKRLSLDHGIKRAQSKGARTQIQGTQVFDANFKLKPTRMKRRFSEGEKERIALVRKAGACRECRRMKRKVLICREISPSTRRLTHEHSASMLWRRPQQRHRATNLKDQ